MAHCHEKSSWRSQWERRDQFDLWSEWIISSGIYNHILNIQTPCVLFGPTLLIKCWYPGTRSNLLSLYTGPCVRPAWYGGLLFQVPSIVNGPKLFAPRWILKYAPCISYEWMKPFLTNASTYCTRDEKRRGCLACGYCRPELNIYNN